MEGAGFPVDYEACRTRFRRVAERTASSVAAHPIAAHGEHDLELTIDVGVLGNPAPRRALLVMNGVHGVEGFGTSPILWDALERWSRRRLPDDVGVVFVHGVNPWGMAWWRRQNESNVDLNRNWGAGDPTTGPDDARHDGPGCHNPGYAQAGHNSDNLPTRTI